MAFDWEHVEAIRAEQDSARNRRDLNTLPTNEVSNEIYNSPSGREAKISGLDHWEQLIYKVRTQLIDYIIEHGLVQGFEYDGINEPIKNGKIVLTAEMLQRVTDRFGYFKEKETLEFIEKYLPEHYYVSDADYVHTDNNYTDEEKAKLEGIEDGAEVNKVISILFNGVETIDPATRVATITIAPADIKAWYEQNPDTNVFSDADKEKLDGVEANAQINKVEDVTVDGVTILDPEDKTAKITKKLVKASYESNPDTNAFTDAEKTKLEGIEDGAQVNDVIDVTLDGKSVVDRNKIAVLTAAAIKTSYESNANTNAFTDADKELVEKTVPTLVGESHDHEKRIGALELSQHLQDDEISKLKEKDIALENEIAETKSSISELGDEVNSVAGRVTNLEASQAEQDKKIEGLVPYEGATKDVNLGNHNLYVGTRIPSDGKSTSARIAVGRTIGEESPTAGLTAKVDTDYMLDDVPNNYTTSVSVYPEEVVVGIESTINNELGQAVSVTADVDGLHIAGTASPSQIDISPGVVTGLDKPIDNKDAVNKEYVDALIGRVMSETVSLTLTDVPPNEWKETTISTGSFINIPWNDLLSVTIWISGADGVIATDVDYRFKPVNFDKKFDSLKIASRYTGADPTTNYTINTKIAYKK